VAMDRPRLTYITRPDATAEAEVSVLAHIYALILNSAKKRGRLPDKSGPKDAMKGQKHDRAHGSILD
jgi:hypothetical protein